MATAMATAMAITTTANLWRIYPTTRSDDLFGEMREYAGLFVREWTYRRAQMYIRPDADRYDADRLPKDAFFHA
jgi:hypothetical protein